MRDLQDEALTVAARLGADRNEHWSAFGTNEPADMTTPETEGFTLAYCHGHRCADPSNLPVADELAALTRQSRHGVLVRTEGDLDALRDWLHGGKLTYDRLPPRLRAAADVVRSAGRN